MNMARYHSHIPGSSPYSGTETGYHVHHSASHNSESYVAKSSEQTVEFRGVTADHHIHSPRKEVRGVVGDPKPGLMPWGSTRERADRFTHQVRHGVLAPAMDNSSPTRNQYSTTQDYGDKPVFFNSTCDHLEKVEGFSPKARHDQVVHIPNKGSPKNNFYRDYSSPTARDHDEYSKYSIPSKGDHEVECKDGMCVINSTKERPNYLNNEHSYVPPAYTVPSSSFQPRKDTYYEKSPIYNNDDIIKGNSYITPPYSTVPVSTQPKKETRPNIMIINPPPIKTRIDRGSRDMEFSNGSGKNSPVSFATHYNSPTRKDHRYAKASPRAGAGTFAEEYVGTIDSEEAARKYHGLLLSS